MRDFAGIVLGQPSAQIVSEADVEMLRIKIFQNVDVFHGAHLRGE
jgi:hypothetical protein